MAKKESHEKVHHVHHTHSAPVSPRVPETLEERIVVNLVELQKVHATLAEKYDKLANQIANLLTLFEMSARAFAKQIDMPSIEKDKEFLDKIDRLLEQNKTIAKGLTMMDEKMRERLYGNPTQNQAPPRLQPLPYQPPAYQPAQQMQQGQPMSASMKVPEPSRQQSKFP